MAALTIRVRVKPRSRVSSLEQTPDGSWVARLMSPPVDGRANEELIALVAKHFRCRKASVRITSGATSRVKRLSIDE
jgi:uncharacterized protein (TIGR00251 family)